MTNEPETHKTLKEMTDAEIGALLRAHHEGKVIEGTSHELTGWVVCPEPQWHSDSAYRIRPEPVRETVTLTGGVHSRLDFWCFGANGVESFDTHRITFDLNDGKPDCASIRMEKL